MTKISLNKLLILICIIASPFLINCAAPKPDHEKTADELAAEAHTKKIINDLDITQDEKVKMTKEKFKNFMRSLLTRPKADEDPNDPHKKEYVERIVEKISKNVPEEFGMEEMNNYLDEKIMVRVMEEVNSDMAKAHENKGKEMNEQESNTDL